MNDGTQIVVIAGGTGFLGRALSAHFIRAGWRVIVLSRSALACVPNAEIVQWDGGSLGEWERVIDGADVLVNLAGRSVNCRYNARNRYLIRQSRVESTRALGHAVAAARWRPRVWLNSSTATIYRHAEDRPQSEQSGELGSGFSVDVARAWEAECFGADAPGVRRIAMRSAMVMGRGGGGPFAVFRVLARFGLGGRMGSGRQYVSWIHIDDFCRVIDFLIQRDDLDGPINIAAPNPLSNAQFMRETRHAVNTRFGLPASRWMLEIGAFLLRTETELPLKSRFVVPQRLLDAGFRFEFPTWRDAARDLAS